MKKNTVIGILIWLLLLNPAIGFGQHPLYKNIGVNEGLPSSSTYYVLNDKKGYIWIASDLGLTKFNGKDFKTFSTSDGLNDNSVICLAEDSKGIVWMASGNSTLSKVSGNKITEIPASQQLSRKLRESGGSITNLQFDEKDTLWIATTRDFYKISPKNNYSQLIEEKRYSSSALVALKSMGNNRSICSQYKNTQLKVQIKNQTGFAKAQFMSKNELNNILEFNFDLSRGIHPRNSCVLKNKNELYFSYANKLFLVEKNKISLVKECEGAIIYLYIDEQKNLYVSLSNNKGVLLFENGDTKKNPFVLFENSLIGCICQDFEGGMWFTSTDKGVFYIPWTNSYNFEKDADLCENIQTITAFNGTIITVDAKNRITLIDSNGRINKPIKDQGYNQGHTSSLTKIDNIIYYCGSTVFEFDPFIPKKTEHHFPSGIPLTGKNIAKGYNNQLYGLLNYDLCTIQNKQWKIIQPIPHKAICMFYHKKTNRLLIGTKKGLYQFDGKHLSLFDSVTFHNKIIIHITEDKNGSFVIGTKNSGLFIFKDAKWMNLTTKNGLTSNFCLNTCVDENNVAWVSTNNGISYFNLNTPFIIYKLNKNTGLNTNEISCCFRYKNLLYVASRMGLIKMKLPLKPFNDTEIPIIITAIDSRYPVVEKGKWSYTKGPVRFNVDCLTYKQLFNHQFAYKLTGYDNSTKITNNNYIEYSKLNPSTYTLWLGAVGSNGKIQNIKPYYTFTILTPFWQQWWFYGLIIICCLLLVLTIVKLRVNHHKKKLLEKRNIEKLIFESQITALQAQMNPHFTFNCISSIQELVLNNKSEEAYNYLSKFARLLRLVLENAKKNYITIEKELEWLKLYVELEQLRFSNKFEYIVDINEQARQNAETKMPSMIIQPFIENAIWHGLIPLEDERQGKLLLSIQLLNDKLTIVVEDNGVGRNYSKKINTEITRQSLGLKLVKDKLDALNKSDSLKGEYSIIDLANNNVSVGTKIIINYYYEHENTFYNS